MESRTLGILLILVAVCALTAAQVTIKLRLSLYGAIPLGLHDFIIYILKLSGDWKLWLAAAGLVLSAILWYTALSRLPLSLAYPFAALSFPLIYAGSVLFLQENFSWQSLVGNGLIVFGIILATTAYSRG